MSKRLTYREQLEKARQATVVAGLREAARLAAEGAWSQAQSLVCVAQRDLQELMVVDISFHAARDAMNGVDPNSLAYTLSNPVEAKEPT